jgi:signal recognition particle receptor subunit beta
MPLVNHARQEIHLKVVYYGPGLGGKTTNLEHIHARTKPERRGKLISLATEAERTLFFDLLPVELGVFKGYQVRLHLCTVPGQIAHDRTRRLVLRHVDGIVFVADSQAERLSNNLESIVNLHNNLRLQGDDPDVLPLVVQYNKRDLPDILDVAELRRHLRVPRGVPEVEAIAITGVGVFDTVKTILKQCLKLVGDPRKSREGRSPSILPGKRASMFPNAPGPALGSLSADGEISHTTHLPLPPRLPRLADEE